MRLLRDHRRMLLRVAAIAMALVLVSIVAFDGLLAVALSSMPNDYGLTIDRAVTACEVLFAFPISPYLYGILMVMAGLVSLPQRQQTLIPWVGFAPGQARLGIAAETTATRIAADRRILHVPTRIGASVAAA